jgi:hypothetical protein
VQRVECEFEADVLAAVLQSRWPERADAELRDHAAGCAICRDVAAIAGAFDQARDEMRPLAVVPGSGRVWFLAQMRARREAERAAARPMAVAQIVAAACAAGLLFECWDGLRTTVGWLASGFAGMDMAAQIAALGVAGMILLLPAAAWLAIRGE